MHLHDSYNGCHSYCTFNYERCARCPCQMLRLRFTSISLLLAVCYDNTSMLACCCLQYCYLMAAANAADPKTERNRLGGSGRVGPSRAE